MNSNASKGQAGITQGVDASRPRETITISRFGKWTLPLNLKIVSDSVTCNVLCVPVCPGYPCVIEPEFNVE